MATTGLRRVERGAGEPAVVLEAGSNCGAEAWDRVTPLLAPQVRVVAYDRAGIGGSVTAPGPADIGRQAGDLESVITGLGAGPCVLAAHSWGCFLVQRLALRRPELVAGLVLVDPGHERMMEALHPALHWGFRHARAGRRDELRGGDTVANALAMREIHDASPPFPDVPVAVLSAGRGVPRRFRAHWTGLQAELAAAAPRGRHLVVSDSGHSIPRRRPAAVAGAIMDVVGQVRAGP